jgi:uncharacterized repeat protein (TIGR01451 family)
MFFSSWRQWLSRKSRPLTNGRRSKKRPTRYRLQLEGLEDRLTPSGGLMAGGIVHLPFNADEVEGTTGNNSAQVYAGNAQTNATLLDFTDTGAAATVNDYTVTVTWGDGSSSTASGANGYLNAPFTVTRTGVTSSFHVVPTATQANAHVYEEAIDSVFTVQVNDNSSAASTGPVSTTFGPASGNHQVTEAAAITVANPPTTTASVNEGDSTTVLTVAQFTDPGNTLGQTQNPGPRFFDADQSAGSPEYSVSIDWGDGSPAQVVDSFNNPADFTVVSHTAAGTTYSVSAAHTTGWGEEEGSPHNVSVSVTHEAQAAVTQNNTLAVSVNDVPVTVNANSGTLPAINEGGTTAANAVVGTFTDSGNPSGTIDPGQTATNPEYRALVSWGDGTTTTLDSFNNPTAFVSVGGGTFQVHAPAHSYFEEKAYTISLSVGHEQSGANLVTNGGFETPGAGQYASIPGWSLVPGTGGGTIEIANFQQAFEGNQFTELNSNGPATIFQDVPTTAGQTYILSFAFTGRAGTGPADNQAQVSIAGTPVATVTNPGNTTWTVYNFSFTATAATTRIQFASLSPAGDTVGGELDAVTVVAASTANTASQTVNEVQITNLTPTSSSQTINEGGTTAAIGTIATFTDPAGQEPNAFDPSGTHYTATVNWGDGTTSPGTITPGPTPAPVNTIPAWDGSSSVAFFGIPDTATYGQTITAPAGGTLLTSFTFEMNLPATVAFRGEVYAWNGTMATGSSLFESPVMSTAGAGFQAITFNIPGGVPLVGGQKYVIFASTAKDQAGHSGTGSWGQTQNSNSDGDATTGFVFLNDGGDGGAGWTTQNWSQDFLGAGADLAYSVTFSGSNTFNVAAPAHTYAEESAPGAPYQTTVTVQHEGAPALTVNGPTVTVNEVQIADLTGAGAAATINEGQSTGNINLANFFDPAGGEPQGLLHWYRGEGNANDNAGTANGTIVGNVTFAPGKVGQAFSFPGTVGSYVNLGTAASFSGTGAFSIAVGIKTTSNGVIIQQRDSSAFSGEYVLTVGGGLNGGFVSAPGKVTFTEFSSGTGFGFNFASNATVNDGNFHYIVAERLPNGTGQIYIDGVLDSSQASQLVPLTSSITTYLGEDVRDSRLPFNGLLDEVQLYNRALPQSEVTEDTNAFNAGTNIVNADYTTNIRWGDGTTTAGTVTPSTGTVVSIFSGFNNGGDGSPFSNPVGSFTAPDIQFGASQGGFNWHPFGLSGFGADFQGNFVVASTGNYTFSLNSDDGSQLFIDGVSVVDDSGLHPPIAVSGTATLTAGTHTFEVRFFEDGTGTSGVDLTVPAGVTYGTVYTVSGSHTYTEDGTFLPEVTVTHETAAPVSTGATTATVTVNEVAATVNSGAASLGSINEGQATPANTVVGTFTDPGNTTGTFDPTQTSAAPEYRVVIAWGDTTNTTVDSFNNPSAFNYTGGGTFQVIAPAHTFAEEGNFTVSLTVSHWGPQLVENGGFENGDFTGWTQGGNTGDTGVDGSNVHSGSFAAFLGPVGSDGTLTQNVATVAGQQYVFSFWLESDGGTPNDFSASVDGTTVFSVVNDPAHGYQQHSFTFTATGASTQIQFAFRNDPGFLHLDDVGVVALTPFSTSTQNTETITVNEVPVVVSPVANLPALNEGGSTGNVVVATFTDPAGAEPVLEYAATINWGDGTSSPGTVTNTGGNNFSVSGSHTYGEESPVGSPYAISVTVAHGNLVVNPSFETPGAGQYGGSAPQIPGWSLVPGTGGGTIEIGNFQPAYDGNQFTELNSNGPATIFQDVPTVVGQSYTFAFAFAARVGTTATDNNITVSVGGTPLATLTTTSTAWVVHTFSFTATGTTTRIQFASNSPAGDTVGGLIDGVQFAPLNGAATTTTHQTVNEVPVVVSPVANLPALNEGGSTGNVVVATFTDPAGAEPVLEYAATISWGDGTSSPGTVTNTGGNNFNVSGSHTYGEESGSPYAISVTVAHGNQVVNPSFEATPPGQYTGPAPQIPGWSLVPGTGGVPPSIEVANFQPAFDGTQFTELNSNGPATIFQDVPTVAGQSYTFAFAFAARVGFTSPTNNNITVSVGGTPLATLTTTSTAWVVHTFSFTATGTTTRIQFASNSPAGDSVGGLIDGVQFAPLNGAATTTTHQTVNEVQITNLAGAGFNSFFNEGSATTAANFPDATFTDPAGAEPNASDPAGNPNTHYTATIDYGDGTTATGNVVNTSGNNFQVQAPAHTYGEEGVYTVRVTVQHEGAAPLTVVAGTNTVLEAAVTANASSGTPNPLPAINEGQSTAANTVVGTFTDPGNTTGTFDATQTSAAPEYRVVIAWGDSTTTTVDSFNNPGAFNYTGGGTFQVIAPAHQYTEEGHYTIALTVSHWGPQLVSNGGFETGSFSGWTQGGNTGDTSVGNGSPHSGTFAADLGPVGSDGTLSQNVATVAGQQYVFSFWLANDGGTPSDFSASVGGTTVFSQVNAPSQPYTQYSFTFTAFAASTQILFTFRNDPAFYHLDDVGVVALTPFSTSTANTDTITVNEVPVVVTAGPTVSGVEGSSTNLVLLARFTDNNPVPEPLTEYDATVTWGDGTPADNTTDPSPNIFIVQAGGGQFLVEGTHTYGEESPAGGWQITTTVHHHSEVGPDVDTTVNTQRANITDPAVSGMGNFTFNAMEGVMPGAAQTVATFTDPAGAEPNASDPAGTLANHYSATINWGDGTGTTAGTITFSGGTFTVQGNHRYTEEGPYTISTVIQHESAPSTTVTSTAVVAEQAVVLNTTPLTVTGQEGAALNNVAVATFTDPGGNEPVTEYAATIDWGDGTTSPGFITFSSGTYTVLGSHTYIEESGATPYAIQVTVVHGTTTASTPNLVANGGFETGNFSGWTQGGNTGSTFVDTNPADAHSGNDSAALGPVGSDGTLSQNVATVAGQEYVFSFWLESDGGTPNDFSASVNGTTVFSVTNDPAHGYVQHTFIFVATGASTPIQFAFRNDPGFWHLDDVRVGVASASATVTDPAVVVTPVNLTGTEGQSTGTVTVATFTDPGGPESTSDYGALINWGDGTTTAGTIVGPNGSGVFSVQGSHTYAEESGPETPGSQPYQITVSVTHENLLTNGGFEQPAIGGGFALFPSIPGWSLVSGPSIELDANGTIGTVFEGNQALELNSNGPSTIAQTVATVPGQSYQLSLAFSARGGTTPADNDVQVSIGGVVVDTLVADGTSQATGYAWTVHTYTFTATSTSTTIQLASLSPAGDSVGGELDDVSFTPTSNVSVASSTATVAEQQISNLTGAGATQTITPGSSTTPIMGIATFTDTAGAEPNASDPGGTPNTHYTTLIHWGDGTTSPGNVVITGATTLRVDAPAHTYTTPGVYNVTVDVTHETAATLTVPGAVITVRNAADLSVTKRGPTSAPAGSNITYTITVTNSGPQAAQNVQMTDMVPAGTAFVSESHPSGWTFSFIAGTVTESTGTLTIGASATFTIVVHAAVTDPVGSTITNTANVSSSTFDPNTGNNSSTVMTTVTAASADLSVLKTGPTTVTAGTNLTYTITVRDNGPSDAQNVSLTDAVPAGTTFVSETQTSGPAFMVTNPPAGSSSGTVSGNIGLLGTGVSATFMIVVQANASDASGSTITNTAMVSTTTTDPNSSNNSSTTNTAVKTAADLRVTMTGPLVVPAGANLTYTITVSNLGPSDAQSVQLTDAVPSGSTFVSEQHPNGWTSSVAGGTITESTGTLAAGASATFTIVLQANSTDPNGFLIRNIAQVMSTTFDPFLNNNMAVVNSFVGLAPPP